MPEDFKFKKTKIEPAAPVAPAVPKVESVIKLPAAASGAKSVETVKCKIYDKIVDVNVKDQQANPKLYKIVN